ncbi:HNH endonuclease [Cyanobium sp. BSA11S]|nr:HNH endonuclease [Synechococcus sp. BSF8S]
MEVRLMGKSVRRQELTAERRFWAKVRLGKPDECWEWQAGKFRDGYGQFWYSGKNLKAPRVAWVLANGQTLACELVIRHKCDNPSCCNPWHLEYGMGGDNVRDRDERGRTHKPKGELHSQSVLTEVDVRAILASEEPQAALAVRYGVHEQHISNIRCGRAWGHLQVERRDRRRRLTEDEIRAIFLDEGTCEEIAARFPCSRSMVSLIKTRKNHAAVTADL